MIDFYYWPTPNGWKVAIMLEECGLEYRVVPVNIGKGDQFKPEFLAISPNNRMPAIVDHDAGHDDPDVVVAVWDRRLHAGVLAAGGRVAPANLDADIYRAERSASPGLI